MNRSELLTPVGGMSFLRTPTGISHDSKRDCGEVEARFGERMLQLIELQTTIRGWQYAIRQLVAEDRWSLDAVDDSILFATVFGEAEDQEVASEFSVTVPELKRCRIVSVFELLKSYHQVLVEYIGPNRDNRLIPIAEEVEHKSEFVRAYLNGYIQGGGNDAIMTEIDQLAHPNNLGWLMAPYVVFRAEMYAEQSGLFASASELAEATGYTSQHLRYLIRTGQIAGLHTYDGWYGMESSISQYQKRPNRPSVAGIPRKNR